MSVCLHALGYYAGHVRSLWARETLFNGATVRSGQRPQGGKMLVLSRRRTQALCIGDTITVTVLRISRDRIQIGVSAPHGSRILRSELLTQPAPAIGNTRR